MDWGNAGSQQYDHDAMCAHTNMWYTITEHNGHETIGMGPFLNISYRNELIGMKQVKGQRAIAPLAKLSVWAESVRYKSRLKIEYSHVGNREMHVNFS